MATLLLLLGLLVSPCLAQDGVGPADVRIYASTPLDALLTEATLAHDRGDALQVIELLGAVESRLLAGEEMQAQCAVRALALLGAARLERGDDAGAAAAFRLMAGRVIQGDLCPATPQPSAPAPPARTQERPAREETGRSVPPRGGGG